MSYEDEYTSQYDEQNIDDEPVVTDETEEENPVENINDSKQQEKKIFTDISSALQLLTTQVKQQQELIQKLTAQIEQYNVSTQKLEQITENMPETVHEKCLEEYKKIINNAAKNYNQLQKSVSNWHKTIEKDHDRLFKWISISSVLTPILLLILILLQLF